MTPRRLLFLTPFPPRFDASHGGARATAHLIGGLAERHEVALLCFRAAEEPSVDAEIRRRCVSIEEVPRRGDHGPLARRVARGARLLAAPFAGRPVWVEAFRDPAFSSRLRRCADVWRPDIVQAEFHVMGPYLRTLGLSADGQRARTVLVEHEPGVPVAAERTRAAPFLTRAWHRLDEAAWRRAAPRMLRSPDAIVAFTARDRQALLALAPEAQVETIPIAVPLPGRPSNPAGHDRSTILFVGSFDHPPNRDAAFRLIGRILPLVRAQCPEARLTLVGHQPDGRIESMAGEGVTVTGRVPDVAPYLEAAALVVAPIFTGGGMRLKVLEALAAGKAVVASPLAVEGVGVADGEHVAVARDDAAFADRIVELLRDAPARAALAERARAWAERHVSVHRMVRDYEALYERILAQKNAPNP
jgi:glycosyltransferase involved in cell wall biosynthesis